MTAERTSTTAIVRVRGEAESVFPWLALRVDQTSTGPVERFVPQAPATARRLRDNASGVAAGGIAGPAMVPPSFSVTLWCDTPGVSHHNVTLGVEIPES